LVGDRQDLLDQFHDEKGGCRRSPLRVSPRRDHGSAMATVENHMNRPF